MRGKARLLQMREERWIICASKHDAIQQEPEECPPSRGIPLALEERTLFVNRGALEHPCDATTRMHKRLEREHHASNESLGDPRIQYAAPDRSEASVPIRTRFGAEQRPTLGIRVGSILGPPLSGAEHPEHCVPW